jgi:hypothetical protein
LTHVGLAAVSDRGVDRGNQSGVASGAVDAPRVQGTGNTERYMVEDVKGLELELALDALRDGKVLEERDIREVV